jgi:hypothetical protein
MNRPMKKKPFIFTALFLVFSLGSMMRITAHSQIRAVDYVAIMAVGMLIGVLIVQLVVFFKAKKKAQ